jgi:ribosomal protein S27AE
MGSDESTAQERQSNAGKERGDEGGPSPTDQFVSESKTCPECGEPIHDVRKTCPNCGYEYKEEDYDNKEAGEEFVAGSQIDEQGEEIVEEGVGAGEEKQPDAGNVPPRSQREREADSPEGPEADSDDDSSEDSSEDSSDEEDR